jgi:hypothetical protein
MARIAQIAQMAQMAQIAQIQAEPPNCPNSGGATKLPSPVRIWGHPKDNALLCEGAYP